MMSKTYVTWFAVKLISYAKSSEYLTEILRQ